MYGVVVGIPDVGTNRNHPILSKKSKKNSKVLSKKSLSPRKTFYVTPDFLGEGMEAWGGRG